LFLFSADSGIRRSDVVNWYLKEKESEIESEAELEEHTFLIGKIIDRLVKNVSYFSFFPLHIYMLSFLYDELKCYCQTFPRHKALHFK